MYDLCRRCGVSYVQTKAQFLKEYRSRTANRTGLTGHQEAPYGYDSVWTIALVLNNSIQRMTGEGFACFYINKHQPNYTITPSSHNSWYLKRSIFMVAGLA